MKRDRVTRADVEYWRHLPVPIAMLEQALYLLDLAAGRRGSAGDLHRSTFDQLEGRRHKRLTSRIP